MEYFLLFPVFALIAFMPGASHQILLCYNHFLVSCDSLHHRYSLILFEPGVLYFFGLQNHTVPAFQQWHFSNSGKMILVTRPTKCLKFIRTHFFYVHECTFLRMFHQHHILFCGRFMVFFYNISI